MLSPELGPDPESEPQSDLGYYFYPPRHRSAPGYPRLDVMLNAKPTGQHFDPQTLHLTVTAKVDGEIIPRPLTLRAPLWPWQFEGHHHMCAGRVRLADHRGKWVEVFTFGGRLFVRHREKTCICVLTSVAPIVHLAPRASILDLNLASLLVNEVEILFAQRCAVWIHRREPQAFKKRLAAVEPLLLYVACLEALSERFARFPLEVKDGAMRYCEQLLRRELAAHADLGALMEGEVPRLEDLL